MVVWLNGLTYRHTMSSPTIPGLSLLTAAESNIQHWPDSTTFQRPRGIPVLAVTFSTDSWRLTKLGGPKPPHISLAWKPLEWIIYQTQRQGGGARAPRCVLWISRSTVRRLKRQTEKLVKLAWTSSPPRVLREISSVMKDSGQRCSVTLTGWNS